MKMTPETRLHVDVEVLADRGQWWPGVIEHLRERGGQREAWVRYSTGVGELRLRWFAEARTQAGGFERFLEASQYAQDQFDDMDF